MKFVVATEISTLILWWRASLLASPTVLPASTVPWRGMAPVRARMASSSVVLPLWNGPTSAMHRGPFGLVPLSAMSASLGRRGDVPRAAVAVCMTASLQAAGQLARGRATAATRTDTAANPRHHCGRRGRNGQTNLRSAHELQRDFGDTRRDVQTDLPLNGQRLQRDRAVIAADQHVRAEPGAHG